MITTKSPAFIVRSEDPLCGGPELSELVATRVTPAGSMFVRNHGTVPAVDPVAFRLRVDGLVGRALSLSLGDLEAFARVDSVVTLQCAGNRRDELIAVREIPGEVAWGAEAIGTGRWSGVRLSDVLAAAGAARAAGSPGAAGSPAAETARARHVAFEGLDAVDRGGRTFGFGASIDLERAVAGDVLIADRLDGEPLPPAHGFPLRLVVPGFVGARSVKWLTRVTVREGRSDNHFEARAYKVLPPDVDPATADWSLYPPIEEAPLHAVIAVPEPGARIVAGELEVRGYATGRGLHPITSVEVAVTTPRATRPEWIPAELLDTPEPGVWVRWRCLVDLPPGGCELIARASDTSGVPQPEHPGERWNPKGYSNDAWHRVTIAAT